LRQFKADADGSGSMTLIELDDWIKSLGINNLSFQDIQFLGSAMDSDGSGFVEADELIKVYERFKYQKVVEQEEAEEVDEEYLKRVMFFWIICLSPQYPPHFFCFPRPHQLNIFHPRI